MALPGLLANPLVQQGLITAGGYLANRFLVDEPTTDDLERRAQNRLNQNYDRARSGLDRQAETRRQDAERQLAAQGMGGSPSARASLMQRVYNANNQASANLSDSFSRQAANQGMQVERMRFGQQQRKAQNQQQSINNLMRGVSDYMIMRDYINNQGQQGIQQDPNMPGTNFRGQVQNQDFLDELRNPMNDPMPSRDRLSSLIG